MILRKDWHIHSMYSTSCGCPKASIEKVYLQAKAAGIEEFGITDHLHTFANVPSLKSARREFDSLDADSSFHFGVELSCVREDDIIYSKSALSKNIHGLSPTERESPLAVCIPEELLDILKFEYIIGGVHWSFCDMRDRMNVIRSYHKQHMFLIQHPLVDIIAHPWWWEHDDYKDAQGKYNSFPWFDNFEVIPQSIHDEFIAAAIEYDKAIEINPEATFLYELFSERFRKQYLEYLQMLKQSGVRLSIGTDQHSNGYIPRLQVYESYIDNLGINESDLWDISMSKILKANLKS